MLKSSLEAYSEQLARESRRRAIQDKLNQKTMDDAAELLSKNVPIEQISEITGLPEEEILKLKV